LPSQFESNQFRPLITGKELKKKEGVGINASDIFFTIALVQQLASN
jgi:hypothetical protein